MFLLKLGVKHGIACAIAYEHCATGRKNREVQLAPLQVGGVAYMPKYPRFGRFSVFS